jgi:hypothetical protein
MDGSDDEFFGGDSDDDTDTLRAAETRAHETRLHKIGFEAAIDEGRERTLQKGFDEGFNKGVEEGFSRSLLASTESVLRRHSLYSSASDAELAQLASDLLGHERSKKKLGQASPALVDDGAAAAEEESRAAPKSSTGSSLLATPKTDQSASGGDLHAASRVADTS